MKPENVLVGRKCMLLPYLTHHVERYHQWMKDPGILELTGSNPLTLEEEYKMRESWEQDEDKLTFIILKRDDGWDEKLRAIRREGEVTGLAYHQFLADVMDEATQVKRMIGDVNLFFHEYLREEINCEVDGGGDGEARLEPPGKFFVGEVEVMIAEAGERRKGIAQEALTLIMQYARNTLKTSVFLAKIKAKNTPSIDLFCKKLGFKLVRNSEVFQEVTLELRA